MTLGAIDRWNNSSEKNVKINVEIKEVQVAKTYEKLLPNKIKAKQDNNKVALVIGVEKYENLICGDEEHCKVSIFRRDKVKDKAVLSTTATYIYTQKYKYIYM